MESRNFFRLVFRPKHLIYKILAERGFDPRTSGLWAQHASTAPLCSTNIIPQEISTYIDFNCCTILLANLNSPLLRIIPPVLCSHERVNSGYLLMFLLV